MKFLLFLLNVHLIVGFPRELRDVAEPADDVKSPVDTAIGLQHNFAQFGQLIQSALRETLSSVADTLERNIPLDTGFHVSCSVCTFGVNLVKRYIKNGRSTESIAKTAVSICVTFKVESELVCRGAVDGFVHQVVYILRAKPDISENEICGFALGPSCERGDYHKKFNWTVEIPGGKPPVVRPVPPPNGLPTKKILHLSDTHLDPFYQEGADTNCGLPLCCRDSTGVSINPKHRAGKWGDYRNCDLPIVTVENMFQHISQTHKIDYIFWTGDLSPHDVYNQTKNGTLEMITLMTGFVKKYFPNTTVFPALGNHETHPVNCFPQPEVTGEHEISWLYDELATSWTDLLHVNISKTVGKGAYYSVLVSPGFRIISLNMNYCNNKNWWLLLDNNDPADELNWLVSELTNAEKNNEKVYILGHIPPGSFDCIKVWSNNYHNIVNRFESTIAAQFYGHTHYDEHMLFYDAQEHRPINIAYVGASMTPYSFLNPAYKIYTVDGDRPNSTRMVLDGETHYMNLTEANTYELPIWRKLYSYKEEYDMESLTPENWDTLFRKLHSDDSHFKKYFRNMHRNSDTQPPCDKTCQKAHLCRQLMAKTHDYSICRAIGVISQTATMAPLGVFE